ncbi:restriction endonuclease subunit S [Anaerovibrio sp.]|uniref:restriction endonuclease subunit S n=1 Tax=Anaerovibrio sp. TaxID=1872532 RepID=UPI0025C6DB27|nr:restriction endonuclease subunit S [Anaerovibrio sp.]MBR2143380.1 restriction endonuclease subunit S [Anaerovibrio sp.]
MMSKLDELMARLCPDGVEYKTLGEIATISRGGSLQKKDYVDNGFPCIHYGQIYTYYNLFADKTTQFISEELAKKQRKAAPNDIIMAVTSENIEDVCKCIAWLGNDEVAVSGHKAIIKHSLDPKYLAYYFHSSQFYQQKIKLAHGTKVIEVSPNSLKAIKIPIPPLEIQREIVRILDNFTELTARKQQYEYYRNRLLSFEGGQIEWMPLHNVVKKHCTGATPKKGNPSYYVGGTVPWIRTQDVRFNEIASASSYITETAVKETGAKWIPPNCVIVAISGATAGRCAVNKISATTNQHCLNMEIDDTKAFYQFVFYCLCNQYEELIRKKQGARGDLNASMILNMNIPVPSREEQKKIAYTLYQFDSLCNDISVGLPAEIEARQQQYEYYRDKLLTFKHKQ